MPFHLVRNDITRMRVDAIVNAANTSLLGGGGVDGAIHRAAGPELLAECRTLNGCEPGEAKITGGYRLPAKYVIHTVGPVWRGGRHGERDILAACYRNSLALALSHGCESVAFPLISAGAYGYPADQAIAVASGIITEFLMENEMNVYLVVFAPGAFIASKKLYMDVQAYIDDHYVGRHSAPNTEAARRRLAETYAETAAEALTEESIYRERASVAQPMLAPADEALSMPDLEELLRQTDQGFSETLLRLIDERGLTDAQCYKRANVDRKLFSKIRANPAYRPSKPTVFAFAVALRLSLPETVDLLNKAGYALSHSSRFDIIMEYFIARRSYDIIEINEVLFQFDMPLLGSGMRL